MFEILKRYANKAWDGIQNHMSDNWGYWVAGYMLSLFFLMACFIAPPLAVAATGFVGLFGTGVGAHVLGGLIAAPFVVSAFAGVTKLAHTVGSKLWSGLKSLANCFPGRGNAQGGEYPRAEYPAHRGGSTAALLSDNSDKKDKKIIQLDDIRGSGQQQRTGYGNGGSQMWSGGYGSTRSESIIDRKLEYSRR